MPLLDNFMKSFRATNKDLPGILLGAIQGAGNGGGAYGAFQGGLLGPQMLKDQQMEMEDRAMITKTRQMQIDEYNRRKQQEQEWQKQFQPAQVAPGMQGPPSPAPMSLLGLPPGMLNIIGSMQPEQGQKFMGGLLAAQMKPEELPADIQSLMLLQQNPDLLRLKQSMSGQQAPGASEIAVLEYKRKNGLLDKNTKPERDAAGNLWMVDQETGQQWQAGQDPQGVAATDPAEKWKLGGVDKQIADKKGFVTKDAMEGQGKKENAVFAVDNLLSTVNDILATPADVMESAHGPIASQWIPTVSDATANYEELVNTLDAQVFLSMIPQMKSMGALSDAEGKRLGTALRSLSLRQDPATMRKNMEYIKTTMEGMRNKLVGVDGGASGGSGNRHRVDF